MSRLDRLVSLLDTGISSYIRNVAAEQIADVQKSRPEELYTLLGRVAPYLQSPKWDTRISAAKTIGLIAENTIWDVDMVVEAMGNYTNLNEELTFEGLDIGSVIAHGTPLLGSAGREYDLAVQAMDHEERMRMQRQNLRRKIGMEFLDDDDLLGDLEQKSDLKDQKPKKRGKIPKVKTEIPVKPEIKEEIKEEVPEAAPSPAKSARLRALAKRKARFGAPPSKRAEPDPEPEKVVVEHRDKDAEYAQSVKISDPREFPFQALCSRLMFDMFEPTWETRHGALLCLREIVRVHGSRLGMLAGLKKEENELRNRMWLEDLACRLCCIFALDRFADYIADQAVAPVRESCAQTLGALIMYLTNDQSTTLFTLLDTLIMSPQWSACHGGMLGLRYFVSLRVDLVVSDSSLFERLVECVFRGLNGSDDEVQAISAAVLLPIASEFVEKRPKFEIAKLLGIMWDYISDLKDELSTSVGNVMDLLGALCTYPRVFDVALSDSGTSLVDLVPKLYQFLRHPIIDVRKAVLRSLKTFLMLEHDSRGWVSSYTLRLLYQNILLEQNEQVLDLTMDLWDHLMVFLAGKPAPWFVEFWPAAFRLLITPIGTARRFYAMDNALLVRPSGTTYAQSTPASASAGSKLDVNIDGPMISGDTLVVPLPVFIRAKVNGAVALGRAAATAVSSPDADPEGTEYLESDVLQTFKSPMSSQRLVLALLLEEYGKHLPENFPSLPAFAKALDPFLLDAMEVAPRTLWRDINPILRAVRTQCQSLFGLLTHELVDNQVPSIPTLIGEGQSGGQASNGNVFTLELASELAGPVLDQLTSQLPPETQVRMAESLEDGRRNLKTSIEEAQHSLDSRNTSIRAASASAYIALNKGSLPSKLNPIIRGLMDEIKQETVPLLHERTATVLAQLVAKLIDSGRAAAGSKIVKNLCGFLCVDVHEAPEFDANRDDLILSLQKDDISLDNKNIAEVLRKERESHSAFIKRQGAVLTLGALCKTYGMKLFDALPEIKVQMFQTLNEVSSISGEITSKQGQGIIDNLAIIRTLVPFLDSKLHHDVENALPDISRALYSEFPVIRHVAAKCLAVVCNEMPPTGISFVVKDLLGKALIDAGSVIRRQGAIEAVFHMMLTMGERILPYIVFFIVPVLGRMSDANRSIRLISATTFASIIKLVPLESGIEDPDDVPEELLKGKEREREFIGQMMDPSRIQEFAIPVDVNATLRRYQQEGVNWLAFLNKYHLHGILCDDMGLGKTLQTICMIASDHVLRAAEFAKTKNQELRKLPSLIICPTTLTGHWVEEFNKYVPSLKVVALVGSPKTRQVMLSGPSFRKADIVVTSYDTARNEVAKLAAQFDWNYCVLDEGHIIKNANSKLAKAVKQYNAYHRLVLTGTPIQNNVLELWSLFDFLMPGFLGTEKSFNERFSKPIAARSSGKASPKEQEAATFALEALHKQVLPFTLRRLKEDVLDDLPPKIIQDYYCELNDTQQHLYTKFTSQQKAALDDDNSENEAERVKNHIFPALQYLRKLCNHPAFVQNTKQDLEKMWPLDMNESPKLIALQQLLRDCGIGALGSVDGVPEAMSQHRALIFCQQREMVDLVERSLLQTHMKSVSYLRMDGTTPGPARQKMVSKFNDDPSIDVLLLTTHVGGLGLNLTGADTVIFVEHDWNPMNDLQAMDRAHRLGQKRTVNVYRLITRNTLEERIMGLQQFKLNIASTVINQQNKGLLSMDTDQILDLFSTSADDATVSQSAPETETAAPDGLPKKNDFASNLGDLWDENEYAEEYNVDNFIKSLKK